MIKLCKAWSKTKCVTKNTRKLYNYCHSYMLKISSHVVPYLTVFIHRILLCILERRNQPRKGPAPPPALGGDVDMKNKAVRTSVSLGKYLAYKLLVLWSVIVFIIIDYYGSVIIDTNQQQSGRISPSPSVTSIEKKTTKKEKNKKIKNKNKKITKDDIGLPSDFK